MLMGRVYGHHIPNYSPMRIKIKEKKMKTYLHFRHFTSILALVMASIVSVHAQTDPSDEKILNDYIASKGYMNTIIFDASNIKQFWVDKTVMSKDGSIIVLLPNKNESPFYKIQLANVNPALDCKVGVITEDPDLSFSIADSQFKRLSISSSKEDFIQYHVLSSSFHLIDVVDFSFNLKFSSNKSDIASIKKIVLFFSNNTIDFLTSPGVLRLGIDNVTVSSIKEKTDKKESIMVRGKNSTVKSQKKIFVSDNVFQNSGAVKNIGDKPTRVYLAYAPYTKDGKQIFAPSTLYKNNNQILKVVSHEKGSTKIVVDSYPAVWEKGCSLALNAKEDLSDFPNCSFVDGRIQEINKINDNQTEIIFNKPLTTIIEPGTSVRIQARDSGTYMYPESKILEPGEEIKFSATLHKDDSRLEYSRTVFCKGTYYVIPIILSYSIDSKEENTVLISDFTVSY